MAKQSSSAKNHDNQSGRRGAPEFSEQHRLEAPNPWPKPPEKANPPEAKGKQQISDK
jgi:hypothetical protein